MVNTHLLVCVKVLSSFLGNAEREREREEKLTPFSRKSLFLLSEWGAVKTNFRRKDHLNAISAFINTFAAALWHCWLAVLASFGQK